MAEDEKKNRPRLTDAPYLAEVDHLILSKTPLATVRRTIVERYGHEYHPEVLRRRRATLLTARRRVDELARVEAEYEKGVITKSSRKLLAEMQTLGEDLDSLMKVVVPVEDPSYNAILGARNQIRSLIRRAKEFREEIDHLSEMRWAMSLMQIRISKMFEFEMQTGLVMRDNTNNLETYMELILKSLNAHIVAGLKPKFGDPKENLSVNVGAEESETQTERFKRLREVVEQIRRAPDAEKAELRMKLLREHTSLPMDTSYEVVKDERPMDT